MRVLVTGATGLVGRSLVPALLKAGYQVTALYRGEAKRSGEGAAWQRIASLNELAPGDLTSIDAVVHLAAHVHQMGPPNTDAEQMYFSVNRDQTLHLARTAMAAGISRFIFISSIKAIGEREQSHPLRETDQERPEDAYGKSKLEAERLLLALAPLAVTVLRFPLVYGPGVKANFAQLARAVERGVPLPLSQAKARRSLLGAENAASAILAALQAKPASSRTYHVADQETPSVCELIEQIGVAIGKRARLFNVPLPILRAGAFLSGRQQMLSRLIEPLRVDTSRIEQELNWRAPHSLAEGLRQMADARVRQQERR